MNLDTMLLESVGGIACKERVWEPGVDKKSICAHVRNHPEADIKPSLDCSCGLWSCKSRKYLALAFPIELISSHGGYYSAQVLQWGVTIEHQGGYRSEYARIIPESIQAFPRQVGSYGKQKKIVKFLRKKYQEGEFNRVLRESSSFD